MYSNSTKKVSCCIIMQQQQQQCLVCEHAEAAYLCGDCKDTPYCSEDCQLAHWIEGHSTECIGARSEGHRSGSRGGSGFRRRSASSSSASSRRANTKWVQKIHLHEGAFTAQAKRHGMSTSAFMHYVLSHSDHFSSTTYHRALFMKNAKKFKH